jgi:hypothetical protein
MTTFSVEKGDGQGEVHALIIGTGAYPYIHKDPKQDLPFEFRALKPLETAPASAMAMADWLLGDFSPPDHSLCTVELLLNDPGDPEGNATYAPPGSDLPPAVVDHPTLNNVKTAFTQWKNRCDASSDNMAIFYICGHGLWRGTLLALLEDTGNTDVKDWFGAAIAFDTFVQNMVQCRAGVQVFIADCCQELAATAENIGTEPGDPLIPVFHPVDDRIRNGLVVKAAQPGLSAHAPNGYNTAYVTQAVLKSFKGRAGESRPDGWRITCGKMVEAVDQVLSEFEDTKTLYCEPRPLGKAKTDLHSLSAAPNVPVRIECKPPKAIHAADLSLCDNDGRELYRDYAVASDVWSPGAVKPGTYNAEAEFRTHEFQNANSEVHAYPPVGVCWLNVER